MTMKRILPVFIIAILGLTCYSNAINNDFVRDDEVFIVRNPAIKDLGNILSFFIDPATYSSQEDMSDDAYRPMMVLSFAIDYHYFKLNPIYYHLENIVFHIFNTILLYFLLCAIFNNSIFSFLSSLIFLTHPAQTEAISWISGRADVLFLFFYLLSFLLYVKYKEKPDKKYLFSLSPILFILAILSKEMAITLPLGLVLYELLLKNNKPKWEAFSKTGFYFIIAGAYMIYRYSLFGGIAQKAYWGGSLYRTMLTMAKAVIYYIKILCWPVKLCADYAVYISRSILEMPVLLSIALLLIIGVIFLFVRKRNRTIAFGIALFFLSLLPVLNIFPVKFIIAERCLYLPSIGFCIIAASIILNFAKLLSKKYSSSIIKAITTGLVILLICSLAARTYARNAVWKNPYTLFSSIVQSSPDNSAARFQLANIYYDKGDYDSAIRFYREAILLEPDYMEPHLGIANALQSKKKNKEALKEYNKALEIKPNAVTYNSMGVLFFEQKAYEKAVNSYKKALALDNTYAIAYSNLGNVYYKLGMLDKTRKAWEKALQLNPNAKYLKENLNALSSINSNMLKTK